MASLRKKAVLTAAVGLATGALLATGVLPLWPASVVVVAGLALVGVASVWRSGDLYVSVLSLSAALLVADAASRPFIDRAHVRAEDRYARLWRVDPSGVLHAPDVDVRWETVGNLAAQGGAVAEPRTVRFRTDALGLRTPPLSGPARVVLLGDSFGAGVGTSQESIAATVLTERHGLPTVNLSVSGASPYDEAVTLDAFVGDLDLEDDAVLLWMLFAGNDFGGECRRALPEPPSMWNRLRAGLGTFRVRSVVGYQLRRLRASPSVPVLAELSNGDPMTFYRPDLEFARLTPDEVRRLPSAECVGGAFDLVRDVADRAGLRLVVAVAPMKVQVYGEHAGMPRPAGGPSAVLESFARERGLPVVPLEPVLREAAAAGLEDGRLVWWQDDTHWNPLGHALVARTLADAIRAQRSTGLGAEALRGGGSTPSRTHTALGNPPPTSRPPGTRPRGRRTPFPSSVTRLPPLG